MCRIKIKIKTEKENTSRKDFTTCVRRGALTTATLSNNFMRNTITSLSLFTFLVLAAGCGSDLPLTPERYLDSDQLFYQVQANVAANPVSIVGLSITAMTISSPDITCLRSPL